jgi:hypothetical protein
MLDDGVLADGILPLRGERAGEGVGDRGGRCALTHDDSVRQDGRRHLLDVRGSHLVPAVKTGARLARSREVNDGTRARAEVDVLVFARCASAAGR